MNIIEILGDDYNEDMTKEELLSALEKVNEPNNAKNDEVEQLKRALTKSNREAADYKKQLKEKMSEEELAKTQRDEEIAELEKNYKALLHESEVNKHKAELIDIGYEGKLAEATAEAMVSGDFKTVMANHKTFVDGVKQNVQAEILKDTPRPVGDGGAKTVTLKELKEMDAMERLKFAQEHPEDYAELYRGE